MYGSYAVGWGSFVLPGTMFLPNAGPAGTMIGFLIGTVVIVILAFNFHKVSARIQGSGGTYGFITKVFGQNHGFLMGWFLFLTYMAILWANATALVLLARFLFGDALQFGFHYTMVGFDVYFGEVLLCLAAIVLCGWICILSKEFAIRLHTFFAFVLIAGVVAWSWTTTSMRARASPICSGRSGCAANGAFRARRPSSARRNRSVTATVSKSISWTG